MHRVWTIGLALLALALASEAQESKKEIALAPDSLYRLTTKTLEGQPADLKAYAGKGRDFLVLGFPSNDFGGQEPGTAQEIRQFCSLTYDVSFPLFEKVVTRAGAGQSPVYANLQKQSGELPAWNFGKYLVARDGRVVKFYPSRVTPDDAGLRKDIETALATR
jgi:glutathione peroxidase